jgi:hypothetical protein
MLDSIAPVCPHLAVIIFPVHSKDDYPVRFGKAFQDSVFFINGILTNKWDNIERDFVNCFGKFRLIGITTFETSHETV